MPFEVFSAARLPWAPSCFQKMAADPGQVSVSFLQTNFRATTSACHVLAPDHGNLLQLECALYKKVVGRNSCLFEAFFARACFPCKN